MAINQEDEVEKIEAQEAFSDDSAIVPPTDIVAYNELRSCADLVRMYTSGQLDIQPDFQREVVWKNPDQTRFIDSIIKQFPIPSMCISLDYNTEKRIVIDGLQRISSVVKFLTKDDWKLAGIEDVDDRIAGKTVESIKQKTIELYTRVQNFTIPITILRCDFKKKSHNEYLFKIFHRLNTGGTKLNNQEIRNCIYSGKLNSLLKRLGKEPTWVRLNDLKDSTTNRLTNEEIILRFFALRQNLSDYNGKLAKFLNDYMHDNRDPDDAKLEDLESVFQRTIDIIFFKIFEGQPIGKISKAMLEGLLVGVSMNINRLSELDSQSVKIIYDKFKKMPELSVDNLKEGISSKEKVVSRIKSSIEVFS